MRVLAISLVLTAPLLVVYAYAVYPALLWLAGLVVRRRRDLAFTKLPTVTVTLPVYNEERNIRSKLEELLQLDYPVEKLQLLVISDASTDGTDRIVGEYASRGVELIRLEARRGKTAAENAAGPAARGSIIVNNDATVRIPPHALKSLVSVFADPTVGVASGRDVSIGAADSESNRSESQYVGYEMWLRSVETRLGSIVGASGCFYAIRAAIYDSSFPEQLSRDFASALMARANGFRAVSVADAVCYVPRAAALGTEYRRKVRTMARGLETLWQWRRMLNPFNYGVFAFMLVSHKLCRWLIYLFTPFAFIGLAMLSLSSALGGILLCVSLLGVVIAAFVWHRAQRAARVSRIEALFAFSLACVCAGFLAWMKVFRRQQSAIWEPTRRPA
jgi:cellulose synthase/poly-beta-1,6-N-acetylglucosamine synthase-like glycosyltransferase